MLQYIPVNINLEELCPQRHLSTKTKSECDKLIHLLHLVNSVPANNKDLNMPFDFTPLYSEILRMKIRNYKECLDYLIKAGVLETDNHYIKGLKG